MTNSQIRANEWESDLKPKASEMIVIYADAEFVAKRRESVDPGWWVVDAASNSFFDGPYPDKAAALERYYRLPGRMQAMTQAEIDKL